MTQDNGNDCGVYMLHYLELFCRNPPKNFEVQALKRQVWFGIPLCDDHSLLAISIQFNEKWFPREHIKKKRNKIKKILRNLANQATETDKMYVQRKKKGYK
jgi:Ulp1 family protease